MQGLFSIYERPLHKNNFFQYACEFSTRNMIFSKIGLNLSKSSDPGYDTRLRDALFITE